MRLLLLPPPPFHALLIPSFQRANKITFVQLQWALLFLNSVESPYIYILEDTQFIEVCFDNFCYQMCVFCHFVSHK